MLCDVALLNTVHMRWAVLEFRGVPPAPRASAVGAVIGAERRLWVFGGGTSPEALPLNDVHTFDVSRLEGSGSGSGTVAFAATDVAHHDSPVHAVPADHGASSSMELACVGAAVTCMRSAHSSSLQPPPRAHLASSALLLQPALAAAPLRTLGLPPPPLPPPLPLLLTADERQPECRHRRPAGQLPAECGDVVEPAGGAAAARAAARCGVPNVVLDAHQVRTVRPACAEAPAPATLPESSSSPNDFMEGSGLGDGGGCATVLVRRDGRYILKVVKDESCTGCAVCRSAGTGE